MALDYQKAMYSKEKIERDRQEHQRRTSYEQMSLWQSVATPGGREYSVDELLERQQYPAHLNYTTSGGYDDSHKSFLRFQKDAGAQNGFPQFGPPRIRNGKTGASWRHVTEVLQAGGSRLVFMDDSSGVNLPNLSDGIKDNFFCGIASRTYSIKLDICSTFGRQGLADMTLIREDIPGCNLTHRLAEPPKTMTGGRFMPRAKLQKQLGSHELEAFKGTESGNWHLMR